MQSTFEKAFQNLNPQQKQAVLYTQGPCLVIAGAGSGKTRVVTLRIAHLMKSGVLPSEILAVTFTNKAAREMQERVQSFIEKGVCITTFHSLGLRIIQENYSLLGFEKPPLIYDEDDTEKLLKECAKDVFQTDKCDTKSLRSFISTCKSRLLLPNSEDISLLENANSDNVMLYRRYTEQMKSCGACDFDDLLLLPIILFKQYPDVLERYQTRYKHILVDEYQDTNFAQYTIIKLLVEKAQNLMVVGDPDQSIYSWRGANIQNILNFTEDYPEAKVIRLEQNYRSTNTILEASNLVIKNNSGRPEKNLWSNQGDGEKIEIFACESERKEAQTIAECIASLSHTLDIPFRDIAIFYRTNVQSRLFEDALLRKQIPYIITGGLSFYQRREIKDILAYLRLLCNSNDIISFLRIVNVPKRGLGPAIQKNLLNLQESTKKPLIELLQEITKNNAFSDLPFSISQKQRVSLKDLSDNFSALQEKKETYALSDLIVETIRLMRYQEVLEEDQESKQDRAENLHELVAKAKEWQELTENPTLESFLNELLLVTVQDPMQAEDSIHLMTVHNAKGLEFSLVFVVGLEEDLFPHINAKRENNQIEEERRLFYVAMTRAKRRLFLSFATYRMLWGTSRTMRPSRFLMEIPISYKKTHHINPYNDIELEKAPTQKELMAPGTHVFHPQFGIGRIETCGESTLGPTYEVLFSKENKMVRLLAAFAPLKKLSDKS